VLGFLSKAPALIYPLILAAYVWLFETAWQAEAPVPRSRWWRAMRAVLPAFGVTIAFAVLTAKMTPATYDPGADDALLYRVTQPWVAAHYFKWFFLPAELTADRGWDYVAGPWSAAAAAGYMFVIALLAVTVAAARRRVTRPIAFGILWFLFALLPTSLMPLADVTNDHRMFFPFVGLTLAVFWALRLVLSQRTLAIAMAPVLIVALFGTRERNRVWRTDESFWRDVTVKSPSNGRGLTNYALTLIDSHKYTEALIYLQRAKIVRPDYPNVEVSMAAALSALGRDAEAEQHYRRGIELAEDEQPYIEYAAWLKKKGRVAEAEGQLKMALEKNRFSFAARDLLARIDCERGNADAGRRVMTEALPVATGRSADTVLGSATEYCKDADYDRCMLAARRALELRPGWADAYQLIATAYLSMERWDDGVRAALEALRVKPGYSAAKEDLRWGLAHRQS
jgi:Tfp pilus assembly protein PilF